MQNDEPFNLVSRSMEANVSLIQGKPGGRGPSGKDGQKGAKVSYIKKKKNK